MADKPIRAALYLRVSTDHQSMENQRVALEAEAARRNWVITQVYEDAGISGAKARDKRPGLDAALTSAAKGKYDVLMSWAVDRLGRSTRDLINTMDHLKDANIDLYLLQQGLNTRTPEGRMLFGMLSVFAEFERSMIQARVMAGLARRKKAGKRLGPPTLGAERDEATRHASMAKRTKAEALLKAGASTNSTVIQTGLGVGTVMKIRAGLVGLGKIISPLPATVAA